MTRFSGLILVFALVPFMALAQTRTETLADIRVQLSDLAAQLDGLRAELVSTSAAQGGVGAGSALQRMDTIEAQLARLTSKTEQLENRVNKVVTDGTNRLGDLEFRMVELEGGDVGAIPPAPTLGGETATGGETGTGAVVVPTVPQPQSGGAELAIGEQADFDRAKAALDSGDFRGAADLFATFTQSYTGGPLTAQAQFQRGEALSNLGETSGAARAYLDSFSSAPDGPSAPDALYKLGRTLSQLGQMQEACVTLSEVGVRFPGSPAAGSAGSEMQALACQ